MISEKNRTFSIQLFLSASRLTSSSTSLTKEPGGGNGVIDQSHVKTSSSSENLPSSFTQYEDCTNISYQLALQGKRILMQFSWKCLHKIDMCVASAPLLLLPGQVLHVFAYPTKEKYHYHRGFYEQDLMIISLPSYYTVIDRTQITNTKRPLKNNQVPNLFIPLIQTMTKAHIITERSLSATFIV